MSEAPALERASAASADSDRAIPAARLALGAIFLLAVLVRVHEATRTLFWFDEIFTLWVVRLGVPGALELLRHDMHPPLFFLLVAGWRALGGESELWLRLVPMAFGVLTVWAAYALGRDLFGRPAGLLAALLVALHPRLVFHSQELRSFSMLWSLQVVAVWCAWCWVRQGRARHATGYVLAAAAALDTHYLAGSILAVIAAWGTAMTVRTPRRLLAWIGLNAAVALLFAPQAPTFLAQLAVNRVEHWILPPSFADFGELARFTAFGARYLVPVFGLLALLSLARARSRAGAVLVALVVIVPVVAAWLATRRGGHLFTVRYMLYVVPLVLVLVAGGLAQLPRRAGVALGVVIALFAGRALAMKPAFAEAVELRRAAEWVAPHFRPGDVLLCPETHAWMFFAHYHPDERPRLLLVDRHLPYYEGALLIPDSVRVDPGVLDSIPAGARWLAVRAKHAGMDGREAAALFDARTGGPSERWDIVSVWSGEPPR